MFSPLDTSDGLSTNCVLHILELPDGRIAATTPQSIDVWDGQRFQIIPKDTLSSTPLPGYQGAYHVYADKNNRLWVKDYRKIWCYDKQLQFIPDCLPDSADDVFVDDQGDVFFIQQDTTHLLDRHNLGKLAPGAYLINISRGAILSEPDLMTLIRSGHIAGATLDVFRHEPLPAPHPFWNEPRIALTPHISALTMRLDAVRQIAAKIDAIEHGQPVADLVDRQLGY